MSTIAYQGKYFAVCLDESGTEFVDSGDDEVLIVPVTSEGEVILTIEPSAAFGEETVILPGGIVEQGEEHTETASRELQEEVGYIPGQLDYLGELRPFSKYLTTRCFVYLARDLIPSKQEGDEDYPIQLEYVAMSEFEQLIAVARLLDARVIAALYMTRHFLQDHLRGL
jgi:ADP-ribose diphosphatase